MSSKSNEKPDAGPPDVSAAIESMLGLVERQFQVMFEPRQELEGAPFRENAPFGPRG